MTEQNATPEGVSPQPKKRGGRRKFFGGLAIGGLLGTLAASSFSVWSQNGPDGPRHACWGHKRMGAMTPEERAARAERGTDWVLGKVDATPEQRARVHAIVQDAIRDLTQVREQHMQNSKAFVQALKQPTVDRAALAQLRRDELQLVDSASDRLLNSIADAADVLTPEQRGKLAEMAEQFRRW